MGEILTSVLSWDMEESERSLISFPDKENKEQIPGRGDKTSKYTRMTHWGTSDSLLKIGDEEYP
jgi:hypothetical protein